MPATVNGLLAHELALHFNNIRNDLKNAPTLSIPAMNFILNMYSRQSLLSHAELIQENHLDKKINDLIREYSENKTQKHIQLIVLIDDLHYYPVNVFLTSNKPIVFITDFYDVNTKNYFDSRISENTLSQIDLVICMNALNEPKFQNDNTNCGFFSLYHLLLSARTGKFSLLKLLNDLLITKGNDDRLILSWSDLPVEYMLCAQSFTLLFNRYRDKKVLWDYTYIDAATFEELDQYLNCIFEPIIIDTLKLNKNNDLSILQRFIPGKLDTSNDKIINTNIERVINKICQDALNYLNNLAHPNLIDICYSSHKSIKMYLIHSNSWVSQQLDSTPLTIRRLFYFDSNLNNMESYLENSSIYHAIVNDPELCNLTWVERPFLNNILDFYIINQAKNDIRGLPYYIYKELIILSIAVTDELSQSDELLPEVDLCLFYDNGHHGVFELIFIAATLCLRNLNATNQARVEKLLHDDFIYDNLAALIKSTFEPNYSLPVWQYIIKKCTHYIEIQKKPTDSITDKTQLFIHAKTALTKIRFIKKPLNSLSIFTQHPTEITHVGKKRKSFQ